MVAAPVTKAEVATALANVPTLAPRPTFKNINAMEAAILDAVDCIASNQTEDHGYRGMVESAQRYALVTATPWVYVADPGPTRRGTATNPHPTLGTTLTREQVAAEQAEWDAYKEAYNSQQAVKPQSVRTTVVPPQNRSQRNKYRPSDLQD